MVRALPKIVKSLSVIGTLALLLVSGGIFIHKIEYLHNFLEFLPDILRDFVVGFLVGLIVVLFVNGIKSLIKKSR
jgi:predicted DNA repair protein MutK